VADLESLARQLRGRRGRGPEKCRKRSRCCTPQLRTLLRQEAKKVARLEAELAKVKDELDLAQIGEEAWERHVAPYRDVDFDALLESLQ
jgi:hypothetical protein